MFGVTEFLIVVVILMVLFGASRIPAIGKGLGQGIKSLRDAFRGDDDDPPTPKPGSRDA